jgi:hypothetical protein
MGSISKFRWFLIVIAVIFTNFLLAGGISTLLGRQPLWFFLSVFVIQTVTSFWIIRVLEKRLNIENDDN